MSYTRCHIYNGEGVYYLKEKHKYFGQIQLGMSLLNLNICYCAIYCSYDQSMAIIEIDFNYEFAMKMLFTVKQYYFTHMLHEVC